MDCLNAYPFPGNVRELENIVARAVTMNTGGERIEVDDLPPEIRGQKDLTKSAGRQGKLDEILDAVRRDVIRAALSETRSKAVVADKLGVTRQSLYRLIRRLEIEE